MIIFVVLMISARIHAVSYQILTQKCLFIFLKQQGDKEKAVKEINVALYAYEALLLING